MRLVFYCNIYCEIYGIMGYMAENAKLVTEGRDSFMGEVMSKLEPDSKYESE